MNKTAVALLEKHFDLLLDAPDGIKKLRELILTLAMQGKLVPQDSMDQPASELLREIEAEKRRLAKEGKIKWGSRGGANGTEIRLEDVPSKVPAGWEWVRLGDIADYNGRDNARPVDIAEKTWVLDLEDIEKGTSRIISRVQYSERNSKSTKYIFCKGDVLYGKLRPYLDKVIVADSDGVCTTEIVPIVPSHGICAEFLRWLLKRPAFLKYVNNLSYGVKMPRLGTEDAVQSLHPLPPLAEQKRIVAKIDQLMASCDALEELRTKRLQKRLDIHTAAIHNILDSSSAPPQGSAPRLRVGDFLFSHFGDLYMIKENVPELRKAILQLAVMGRLVPQDPRDQPASELLKEIEAEKRQLVKEGKIKVPKQLPEITPKYVPYAVPSGWEWVVFGNIAVIERGGSPRPINLFLTDDPNGLNWIKIGDTDRGGKYITSTKEKIRTEGLVKTRMVYPGDFLLTNSMSFGRPYITKIEGCIHDGWLRISPPAALDKDYLYNLLSSNYISKVFLIAAAGAVVQNLNSEKVREVPIPLPPLAEQKRIVAKIDQLMALCDSLEQSIEATTIKQSAILDAVVAQV